MNIGLCHDFHIFVSNRLDSLFFSYFHFVLILFYVCACQMLCRTCNIDSTIQICTAKEMRKRNYYSVPSFNSNEIYVMFAMWNIFIHTITCVMTKRNRVKFVFLFIYMAQILLVSWKWNRAWNVKGARNEIVCTSF